VTPAGLDARQRAELGRRLSQVARDPSGLLGMEDCPAPALRIGVTGAPGAGQSSLIGALAGVRSATRAPLGILAIDPTSPLTRGSVLGDRIRMDGVAGEDAVFIRSLPSHAAHDGLCSNMEALLRVFERAGFREVILETVGTGQSQHSVRAVVDTVVMVLSPHAGDSIQAMKAGLMEMADIYVVNKSDLPDARRTAAEIRAVVQRDGLSADATAPVLLTCSTSGAGIDALSQQLDAHRARVAATRDAAQVVAMRVRRHVQEVLQRRLAATVQAQDPALWARPLAEILETLERRQPAILNGLPAAPPSG
jgi:LAO/AO transport system kinase